MPECLLVPASAPEEQVSKALLSWVNTTVSLKRNGWKLGLLVTTHILVIPSGSSLVLSNQILIFFFSETVFICPVLELICRPGWP